MYPCSSLVVGETQRKTQVEKKVANETIQLNSTRPECFPCAKQMARRVGLDKTLLLMDSQAAGKCKITLHMITASWQKVREKSRRAIR
jgi:hypothetical protein